LVAFLALAALVAGCGGGGSESSGEESGDRERLEAAGKMLTDARSFEVTLQIEAEEEGGEREEVACLRLGADNEKPISVDMRIFEVNCSSGSESSRMIAVGHRAWAMAGGGPYTAAKISPKLLKELNGEQTTDLQGLFEAAEDIEPTSADTAVEERAGGGEAKSEYSFKAPASAFPGAEGLGDSDVDFEATIDGKGLLTKLVIHGEAGAAAATATESYARIDEDLGIAPPPASKVEGTAETLETKGELEALLGAAP
jgi:hypothetical protein